MTDVFESSERMMTFYLVFHLVRKSFVSTLPFHLLSSFSLTTQVGMSSCCTNPILYGFLNDNFKKVEI